MTELEARFSRAMAKAGVETDDEIVADGELHRVHVEGDASYRRNGWYVLYPDDPPAGAFGCWRRGVWETWCAEAPEDLSAKERRRWREKVEDRRRNREQKRRERRKRARRKARRLLEKAEPADPSHPYLAQKGVEAYGPIRQLGDTLLVPLYGNSGGLRGLQRIRPDGEKRFLVGTEVSGSYLPIGEPDGTVVIAEGYSTAATIREATGHAVAVAFNASNLRPVAKALREKLGDDIRIVLAADNDQETEGNPGLTAATEAAQAVDGELAVPGFENDEEGSDFNDLAATRDLEAVEAAIQEADAVGGKAREDRDEGSGDGDSPTQKARLLRLARPVHLFTDERDRPCAWIGRDGHREVWSLNSSTFKSWLAHSFYAETANAPSASVLTDVLTVLEGRARFEGPTYELANRLARAEDGAIWYDLADDHWRAVRVEPDGWELVPSGPPKPTFRRFAHQEAQVEPVPGGDLADLLLPFLNVPEPEPGEPDSDEHARVLALVWPVVALVPDIPRTIFVPWGRQGSAKTTLAQVYRKIVDPSSTPMPRFPRGDAEMAQVLDHHAAPFFDNVSRLNQRESDTLCRAVTGDGFSKRKLYTDDEDVLYQFRRALLLNGINVPAQRPDLLDRAVLLRMEKIEEEDRVEERVFWHRFEEARPQIFGAVLDALSTAMRLEPDVSLGALPRMADWTRWGYAVAEALGLGGETFLDAYRSNRKVADDEALGSHPVGAAVMAFMENREEWTGQPSALLRKLEDVAEREKIDTGHKLWPGAPNWLSRRINEVEHNLAKAGIRWNRGEGDNRFVRLWREEEESAEVAGGAGGAEESPVGSGDSDPRHDPATRRQGNSAEGMPGNSRPRRNEDVPGTRGTRDTSQSPQSGDGPAHGNRMAGEAVGAEGAADKGAEDEEEPPSLEAF